MNSHTTWRCVALLSVMGVAGCTPPAPPPTAPPPPKPPIQAGQASMPGVPAVSLTAADVGALPPLGQTYTGAVPMLGRAIALPSGTWRVVSQQKSTFRGYPPGAEVTLLRTEGSQMSAVLEIAGNAAGRLSPSGWPLNPVCAAAAHVGHDVTLLAGDTRADTDGGDQDCMLVSFQSIASWSDGTQAPMLAAVSRSMAHLGVTPPDVAILVAFGETDAASRLTERLWLNPDLAGITPDPELRLAHNAWTTSHLKRDAKRRAYLKQLVSWAQDWRQVIRQALTDPGALPPASVAEIR